MVGEGKNTKETNPGKNARLRDLTALITGLLLIVLVNYLGSFWFFRLDLTAENRYSLSDATIDQLETLEDIVFVRVYLEGDLPAEYKELRDATQELLDEFRAYSGGNIEYEFIDPAANRDEEERLGVYRELTRLGLQYTNIRTKKGETISEQILFPGAIVSYAGKEVPVQLLKSQIGATQQEMTNISIQQLEYEFSSAIRSLVNPRTIRVAFIEGHGELSELETADAERALSEFYIVERVKIEGKLDALNGYQAVIIARPDSAFSEKDKFILDQFIMRGGKALWMIDPVFVRMDSLRNETNTSLGIALEHNLTDQLFKYGARLNNDLVLDLEALPIPVVTGMVGNQPRQELFPWFYFPLLMGSGDHPIVHNLDRLKTEFVSTIDTVKVDKVKKTVLLTSSERARTMNAPMRVSLNMLRDPPDFERYNQGKLTTGVLLEGQFPSVFKNRLPKEILDNPDIAFKEESIPTKMIVVADGDIIKNPVSKSEGKFFTLGYDKYTNQLYGNREFILNAMNYLCDDSGLIEVRSKQFKIRLLDQAKIEKQRYFWQILNTLLPILLILIFGYLRNIWRKRRFSR